VRLACAADRLVAERLWLMYRHEMSEFSGVLPNPDGTFRSDRLRLAFTDADSAPYLLMSDDRPVGLAFVRGLTGPARVLNSYFVVRGVRRRGIGLHAVQQVVAKHLRVGGNSPSRMPTWLPFNFGAGVAMELAGEAWVEAHAGAASAGPAAGRLDLLQRKPSCQGLRVIPRNRVVAEAGVRAK
jgi:hypothetical protein